MDLTTELWTSFPNATEETEKNQGLFLAYNVLVFGVVAVCMFCMGTTITVDALKIVLRRPVGPILGFLLQSFVLPATCFGFAILLKYDSYLAISMVVTGSCPGGVTSNVVAFWTKADIVLSITMTTISTTLAIGTLPLNVFIYTRRWIPAGAQIPYLSMVFTMLLVYVSVGLGYLIGRNWPKSIPYFTKIGSISALALVLASGVIQNKLYPELFDLPWTAWFGSFTMPLIAFSLGYLISWVFRQRHAQRMAIGLETGLQNTGLALTIMAVSIDSANEVSRFSQIILLYQTAMTIYGITAIVITMIHRYRVRRETPCETARQQADVYGDVTSTEVVAIEYGHGGSTWKIIGEEETPKSTSDEASTISNTSLDDDLNAKMAHKELEGGRE